MHIPANATEAIAIQNELRHRVRLEDASAPRLIAGLDCSFSDEGRMSHAFAVLMKSGELKAIDSVSAQMPTAFPYVPGLLSFREIPVLLKAINTLPQQPDLFMVDGQGIAHPRRLGIAAHLGVLLDMPTIGVAKSILCGSHKELGDKRGSCVPLMHKGDVIGTVYRSKERCNPLIISPGHRCTQESSVALVQQCLTKYRLPEPMRLADKLSKEK